MEKRPQKLLIKPSNYVIKEPILWGISLTLLAPILVTYAVHFLVQPGGLGGAGFLQYDQFYYIANAREHFDSGQFHFLYNLPFSPFEDSPRIYVQPLSLLLGSLYHFTGLQPGHIYVTM